MSLQEHPQTRMRRASNRFCISRFLSFVAIALLWLAAPIEQVSAVETVTYYYTSSQGTVLATTDGQGNLTSTAEYRPYGSQSLGLPSSGPGYAGHVNDLSTGLVYMQARYYDPALGRFLSVDPINAEAGSTEAFARYSYASNNPITNVDPDGQQTLPRSVYETK